MGNGSTSLAVVRADLVSGEKMRGFVFFDGRVVGVGRRQTDLAKN